jgi:DNA-binding GntR family transcriptional regulator
MLIRRRSLHDELASALRDMIIDGALAAGEKVPEAELCLRFGVSRTPLREALKVVATEGLVTLTPNRGARVAKITPEIVAEIFPIMGQLEAFAGELACRNLSPDALENLEKLHLRMVETFKARNWLAYSKLNRAIHEAIFAAAGNATLSSLYQQLMVRIHAVRFVARQSDQHWHDAVADHEEMMQALRGRNAAALARVMREHLDRKARAVLDVLRTSAPTSS